MTEAATDAAQPTVRDEAASSVGEANGSVASIDPSEELVGSVHAALVGLAQRPVAEHPAVFEGIHQQLGRTLAEIDEV